MIKHDNYHAIIAKHVVPCQALLRSLNKITLWFIDGVNDWIAEKRSLLVIHDMI